MRYDTVRSMAEQHHIRRSLMANGIPVKRPYDYTADQTAKNAIRINWYGVMAVVGVLASASGMILLLRVIVLAIVGAGR